MTSKLRNYLDGHIGDLILLTAFLSALTCYTITVLKGKPDQSLGGITLGALTALGAYMSKRGVQTNVANVEQATITDDAVGASPKE